MNTIKFKFLFLIIGLIVSIHLSAKIASVNYLDNAIKINYEFDDLEFSQSAQDSTTYNVSLNGFGTFYQPGVPSLPTKTETFEVPDGFEIANVTVNGSISTTGIKCAPADPAVLESETNVTIPPITPYTGVWPAQRATLENVAVYRDRHIAFLNISPALYDYNAETIYFCKNMTVTISLTEKMALLSENDDVYHEVSEDYFSSLLTIKNINGSDIMTYTRPHIYPTTDAPWYLIITPSTFNSEAERFATWKRRMGYNVKVESVASSTNLQTPSYVYNLIKQFYTSHSNLEFVLLMGDGNIIKPHTGTQTGGYENPYYTDFYYSCMDGDNDRLPDLWIGRMPAKTTSQLKTIIDKSIEYEKNPPLYDNSFFKKGTHIAEWCGVSPNIYTDTKNFIWTSEKIRDAMLLEGLTVNRVYYSAYPYAPLRYSDNSLIPSDIRQTNYNWAITSTDIKNAMNSSGWYVLNRSHGNLNNWTNAFFSSNLASTLTNGEKLPIVFSINCKSSAFYHPGNTTKSVAEALLWNNNGGAVAVIGANHLSAAKFNDFFAAGMFDSMYPTALCEFSIPGAPDMWGDTKGPMFQAGKILQAGQYWMLMQGGTHGSDTELSENLCHYNIEIYHCLGDPALYLYTKKPVKKNLTISNNAISQEKDRKIVVVSESGDVKFANYDYDSIDDTSKKVSVIGVGYVPELLENYQSSATTSLSAKIKSIVSSGNSYTVEYENIDDCDICLYDMFGNKLASANGSDNIATIPSSGSVSILTLEKNGIRLDSKVVKP